MQLIWEEKYVFKTKHEMLFEIAHKHIHIHKPNSKDKMRIWFAFLLPESVVSDGLKVVVTLG